MEIPRPQRPLQVLHLTAGSEPGGVSRYLVDLCTAMTALGHEVAVAGRRGPAHALFEQANIRWVDVPLDGGLLAIPRAIALLRKELHDHPVDLLHTHYRRSTLVARRLQMHRVPPILYTLHLSDMPIGWRRLISDFGDRTHAPSIGAQRWLVDVAGVAAERVTVVTHGVDVGRFPVATPADRAAARATLGLKPSDVVAAYVGRFEKPKNESWLMVIARDSRQALPNLQAILQGEGPHLERIKQRIDAWNLSDRVRLVPAGDPRPAYAAADLLVLPSAREGFSLSCAEAMATGTPVLRTRTAGSEELIVENVTGCSTPIGCELFVETAAKMLSDLPMLRRMGVAAAKHIRDHFTLERQVNETIELYRNVIAAK